MLILPPLFEKFPPLKPSTYFQWKSTIPISKSTMILIQTVLNIHGPLMNILTEEIKKM